MTHEQHSLVVFAGHPEMPAIEAFVEANATLGIINQHLDNPALLGLVTQVNQDFRRMLTSLAQIKPRAERCDRFAQNGWASGLSLDDFGE
jgi:phosphosulfolactate phosphohydrolase-like enzyme